MTAYEILVSAVLPGFGIGVGYLSTWYVTVLRRQGLEPSWALVLFALSWQFVVLPINLVMPFLNLNWVWALLVFPSIVLGAVAGGLFTHVIGDRAAAIRGPIIGLLIAAWGVKTYFIGS